MTFCSIVVPTVARSTLQRTVCSLLGQSVARSAYEIIVVNDSGQPLPDAPWLHESPVTVLDTDRVDRCVARNAGVARASGKYLSFVDDDDWLLPNALAAFQRLADESAAVWLYGGARLMHDETECAAELNLRKTGNCFAPVMAGEWIPLQASLVDRQTFLRHGGFHPRLLATQDLDLARRFALRYDFANTAEPVACILRGPRWQTTTDYARNPFFNAIGRDWLLVEPAALPRMMSSAGNSYWRGRVLRVYLAAALWSLKGSHLGDALRNLAHALTLVGFVATSATHSAFWRALFKHHVSGAAYSAV